MNGSEFAVCSYTKGSGLAYQPKGEKQQLLTSESFKRRAYWLLENPKFILIHYLDESSKYYLSYAQLNQSKERKLQRLGETSKEDLYQDGDDG